MVCECNAVYLEKRQTLKCIVSIFGENSLLVTTDGLILENRKFTLQLRANNGQHAEDYTVRDLCELFLLLLF